MFSLINVFYFLILILHQLHQSETRGPVCLQCDQVAQLSDCKNIKRCGDQELCVMRKFVTDDGHIWFDVGCSSSKRCSPITSILGKRDYDEGLLSIASSPFRGNSINNVMSSYVRSAVDTVVCEQCCFGDICNAGSMCGTGGFLHEMVCFNCVSSNEDECNTIAICDKGQNCFIAKVSNSSSANITWKTGCRNKDMCQQLQSSQGTDCLSSCCSSDLCNMKCTRNNADCNPNPCIHGTCTSSQQGYKCTCEAGYTGSICNRVIDHCSSNPCVHGICNNSLQGFNCSCFSDYYGSTCREISHCVSNPCVHGICNNSPQGYNCSCFSDYVGSTCTEISPCVARPCKHGICHKTDTGYYCTCDSGFTGSICDTEIITSKSTHWKWKDCGDPATRVITISHFDIFPKPIDIPGNMTSDYDITIHRRIAYTTHLKINVTWDKKLLNNWHSVPCSHLAGTCVYADACEMFSLIACPQVVIDLGFTCRCPIDPIHLVMDYNSRRSDISSMHASSGSFFSGFHSILNGVTNVLSGRFEVKEIPSGLTFLDTGDVRVRIELLEGAKMIGCLAVEFSTREPCHGFLCGG